MSRSREPGAAQRGEAQAVTPDLALVKDEMDAEEYDMSQHGQEQAPLPDLLAVKYKIEIEHHGLQQHLQPDLSRVKVEVDIEEHDLLQQKPNLNCCEVEQASRPGSSTRPELSVVKVEAGAQELSWVMGADPQCMSQKLLVKREPIKFKEESQTAQGASSHSVIVGGIRIKTEQDSLLDESWKLFSSTVLLRDCGAELQQSGRYCQQCRVQFCSRSALADHYMLPTEPPNKKSKFKCKLCEYRFTSYYNLKLHMFTHTGEKPYKCNQCQYSCISKGRLIVHIRTHTGEKPYQCDQCQYSCAFRPNLKSHIMRCHSVENPFKCDQCQYTCSLKVNLKAHKMTHKGEKPFKCDQCNFTSAQRAHVLTHKWTHSSEKPLKCDQCQYTCTRKCSLLDHKKNHMKNKSYKYNRFKKNSNSNSDLFDLGPDEAPGSFPARPPVTKTYSRLARK